MFASKDQFFTRASAAGYLLTRSLRFRASASAYLNRTFGTPTSTTIWTWSAWLKRGGLGGTYRLFGASTSTYLTFNTSDQINLTLNGVSAATSTAVFRDPSSWYHIVYQQNGSAQTIYVNNSSVATGTTAASIFNTAISHQIAAANTTNYFDGYLGEINFIDGQALTPSSFGQTDTATGVWVPKKYTGTYGNNGFYLPLTDTSSTTNLVKDSSGNANNWTPNNISLASASYTTYTSGSGNYTVPAGVTSINYLVVAGGGGGAGSYGGLVANGGGGGGAGGVLYGTLAVTPGQTISYSVGAGGTGSANGATAATSGSNSTFSTFTAIGGGRGGNQTGAAAATGGSGGGGAADSPNQTGAAGTSGQGNAGGNGTTSGASRAGGGGGASAAGANGLTSGNGGAGVTWVNGSTYGGGGGGGCWSSQSGGPGSGGSGGGGAGGSSGDGTAGTANTGGGGGGGGAPAGSSAATAGGNGGSGVVIIGYGGNTTYDSMIDVPYCTGQTGGTQPSGNYCVISPIDENFTTSTAVVSDGNLKFALSSNPANQQVCRGTQAGTTKFYFEVVTLSVGAGLAFGVKTTGAQLTSSGGLQAAAAWEIICTNGNKWNGSSTAYGSAYTTNDIGMCAVDPVNGKIWFGKNGTWFASGDPVAGTNAAFTNVVSSVQPLFECGTSSDSQAANFGQRPFSYTPPTGYSALCAPNLAAPTIANGAGYMAATTYTGTGATQSITNTVGSTSFQPDWVWTKSRSAATDNKITDSVRGVTNALITSSTAAQTTDAGGVTAFNSNGFTVGTTAAYNTNAATYIGWQWKCNAGTTASNTNGSITSTVQVNATSGFSILTYTGTAANATVGHSLGVTPSMVIVKAYSGATGPFSVWHNKLPTPTTQRFLLNGAAAISASATYWNSTTPTSSVFSIGTSTDVNTSAVSYLAYCFTAITGYSAFGSYVGNASTDGPFVYCGFRPRCILIRLTDTTTGENSYLLDTSRSTYNTVQNALEPSQNFSEATVGVADYIDILSNGFKCRSATLVNSSGLTYVFAAFAENPFNYSLAR